MNFEERMNTYQNMKKTFEGLAVRIIPGLFMVLGFLGLFICFCVFFLFFYFFSLCNFKFLENLFR